jgi:Tfp pilus assembly protein PilV
MLRNSPERRRGFTLVEVLVTMFSLVIIVLAAGSLLSATRRATQRQQCQVDARQTARAAADYVDYLLRGATDMNMPTTQTGPSNPGSIMVWTWVGTWDATTVHTCPGTGCQQATYDNVKSTDGAVADLGTDIITFALCENPQVYQPISTFTYGSPNCTGCTAGMAALSPVLCTGPNGSSTNAWSYFQQVSGYTSPSSPSAVMVMADSTGQWGFFQVTNYAPSGSTNTSCCAANTICHDDTGGTEPCLIVGTNIGVSSTINPPGNPKPTGPATGVKLFAGVHYASLRVCNGWLEQKDGLFDPRVDNNCTMASTTWNQAPWTPVIPNVEDLQFAYVYNDGSIWNDSAQTLSGGAANYVPAQAGPGGTPGARDIVNVIGIRITVTGRSASQFSLESARFRKPPAENNPHDGTINSSDLTPDEYYRFQASALAMLRGRTAGS